MRTTTLPAAFIAHGSPMNAVAHNAYTEDLATYRATLPVPKALVVISAHWLTHGTFISVLEKPDQIYDFYGFPEELYGIRYAPPGSPEVARSINEACPRIQLDTKRGFDHAGWIVARHLFPAANVPLLEMSLDLDKSPEQHFAFAKRLREFRDRGIFFVGSGNPVHNPALIEKSLDAKPLPWAVEADRWLEERVFSGNTRELVHYEQYMEEHLKAIPTNEHYLPMLYVLALQDPAEKRRKIHDSIQNGSISMLSFEIR